MDRLEKNTSNNNDEGFGGVMTATFATLLFCAFVMFGIYGMYSAYEDYFEQEKQFYEEISDKL